MASWRAACCLPLLLGSTGIALAAKPAPAVDYTVRHVSESAADCHGDDCLHLRASYPVFAADPALSAWIEAQLAAFATGPDFAGDCGTSAATVQQLAGHYGEGGPDIHASCSLTARVVWETPHLVVFRLEVGADRHWANHTLVYDRTGRKALTLDAFLQPGSRDHFYALFADAEATAFESGSTACPWPRSPGNTASCEFPPSEEFAPAADGVYIIYQVPPADSTGQATTLQFLAAYAQLQGIVRPEWLPGGQPASAATP